MTAQTSQYQPGVTPDEATVWPTFECACGYVQGPIPDVEDARELLAVIKAHQVWCLTKAVPEQAQGDLGLIAGLAATTLIVLVLGYGAVALVQDWVLPAVCA
jgi:hypothetical protein